MYCYLYYSFFNFVINNVCLLCIYIFSRKRKRNWEILQLRTKQMKLLREQQSSEKSATWQRNQRRLEKLRSKYYEMKKISKTESSNQLKIICI